MLMKNYFAAEGLNVFVWLMKKNHNKLAYAITANSTIVFIQLNWWTCEFMGKNEGKNSIKQHGRTFRDIMSWFNKFCWFHLTISLKDLTFKWVSSQ